MITGFMLRLIERQEAADLIIKGLSGAIETHIVTYACLSQWSIQ